MSREICNVGTLCRCRYRLRCRYGLRRGYICVMGGGSCGGRLVSKPKLSHVDECGWWKMKSAGINGYEEGDVMAIAPGDELARER
ncbi:hypothetical protein SERLA73DRAFT_184275 [Serpula lacrymans var. lacrymans S7.3]|uniref:Uncharacterized protein n=2 Tax=Serpula lacrymans var. lacrymans TaxID=341189 RepID=F8Q2X3_SERL3|nr:uncharacterized protein SERLADRAFT_471878 [Serpula lacrymans var. lacrymans S7.9]EGN97534.1 hypothetical protein SERLA73DRAFT_184275 [Serpula lacrymans var. lacrymans S7.3]EGO23135.1 hypothetical protein SERLADRAFT_471878 [Serpula lacrymans var. lacrymans S7.9]